MNPEERALLEHSLKLAEENNKILHKINRRAHWAFVWGFVKIVIIVIPLVLGYLFLQPYIEEAGKNYNGIQELFKQYQSLQF